MNYQLLNLPDENSYRAEYNRIYCKQPIVTHDGIHVRFYSDTFDHAFFESVHSPDDTFSPIRAQRMLWIGDALRDPNALRLAGFMKRTNSYDHRSRVALVQHDHVVIIRLNSPTQAKFISAYKAESATLHKILASPLWVCPF